MHIGQFRAMGTDVAVCVPQADRTTIAEVQHLFAEWEATLTRFTTTSELARLNHNAGHVTIVSPLLFAVVTTAYEAACATDGIYDPMLLRQLLHAGYDRSFERMPAQQPPMATPPQPGGAWRAMRLDAATRAVWFPTHAQLDFGGIAKGMAVDAALAMLRARGIGAALVNAGGDLAVLGLPPDLDHWPVAAPDGTTLALRGGAVATSGVTKRHWRQGDQVRHHIIDPRTGTSTTSGIQTATVITDRCAQGEVAAKAAFILGAEAGRAFLEQHGIAGMLICADGTRVATIGWPQRQTRMSGPRLEGMSGPR